MSNAIQWRWSEQGISLELGNNGKQQVWPYRLRRYLDESHLRQHSQLVLECSIHKLHKEESYQFAETDQAWRKVVFVEERRFVRLRVKRLENGEIFIDC